MENMEELSNNNQKTLSAEDNNEEKIVNENDSRAEMKKKRKNTRWIARIISFIFFPLLIPIYATLLIFDMKIFTYYPTPYVEAAQRTIVIFGIILPCVSFIILKVVKAISDIHLPRKEERVAPYLCIAFCYLCCAYLLYRNAMPQWVVDMTLSVSVMITLESIISQFWRISGHASSMGMLVGSITVAGYFTYTNVNTLFCILLLLTGIVGSARMYLNRHTAEQLIAGFLFGMGCVMLMAYLNPAQFFRYIV